MGNGGIGESFLRIAGAERGDFAAYLRTALKNGYDADPILVIGTTGMAWQAAQSVGARFFPILPGAEEQSWQNLSEVFFPAFMRGESAFIDRDSRSFMRMMLEDIESTIAVRCLSQRVAMETKRGQRTVPAFPRSNSFRLISACPGIATRRAFP